MYILRRVQYEEINIKKIGPKSWVFEGLYFQNIPGGKKKIVNCKKTLVQYLYNTRKIES